MSDNNAAEYEKRINSVINYIETNISDQIKLKDLAAIANFSPFHFHRVFKAFTDETPNEFIWRIRLEKAAGELKYSKGKSLTNIALKNGFESSSVFSKKFKNRYGISPTKFSTDIKNQFVFSKHHQFEYPEISPEINIKQYPDTPVLYVLNRKGYNDKNIGNAWSQLLHLAGKQRLFRKDSLFIGVSFDNPEFREPEKCRYYACISNPGGIGASNSLGSYVVAGGTYATVEFFDTADKISVYYDYIYREWFPSSGYIPGNKPAFDIYMNDPDKDPLNRFKILFNFPVEKL